MHNQQKSKYCPICQLIPVATSRWAELSLSQKKMKAAKDALIRGVKMYVQALGREALVFMVFHGMEGDAPARTEAAAMKRAGGRHSACVMCVTKKLAQW